VRVSHIAGVVLLCGYHAEIAVLCTHSLVAWSGMQVPKAECQVGMAVVLVVVVVVASG
jgi:hypothetical protein